jgi:chromosome partitioning protein
VLVTVAALKGGNCKTTLSCALTEAGAARWGSALLVDADSQASASRWHELAAGAMRADVLAAPTVELARKLATAGAARYPLVVVDCPPAHVEIVRAGLALADVCLIPCRPAIADVDRLWPTATLAAEAGVPVLAVLTMARARTVAPVAAREALRAGRVKVARVELPQREAFARCFGQVPTVELLDFGTALLRELTRLVEKGTR